MAIPPPSFPLRRTGPLPWRPMTDAEWHALGAVLRRGGPGRPPRELRRTWDGIFWVACSKGPWRDLPAAFGKPDSAIARCAAPPPRGCCTGCCSPSPTIPCSRAIR